MIRDGLSFALVLASALAAEVIPLAVGLMLAALICTMGR